MRRGGGNLNLCTPIRWEASNLYLPGPERAVAPAVPIKTRVLGQGGCSCAVEHRHPGARGWDASYGVTVQRRYVNQTTVLRTG